MNYFATISMLVYIHKDRVLIYFNSPDISFAEYKLDLLVEYVNIQGPCCFPIGSFEKSLSQA